MKQLIIFTKIIVFRLVAPLARRALRPELMDLKRSFNAELEQAKLKEIDARHEHLREVQKYRTAVTKLDKEVNLVKKREQELISQLGLSYHSPLRHQEIDPVPGEFRTARFSQRALMKLLADYEFETVLDVGSGAGDHAAIFLKHGKKVTAIDCGRSASYEARDTSIATLPSDFNTHPFDEQFDCVWASHVLERQLNPNLFLRRIHHVTKEGGIVAITVPPFKHEITSGHVSLWNAGLLLYHLILAGFDCRDASILRYGYNISIIVRKKTITLPEGLTFDQGDLRKLKHFLPENLEFFSGELDDSFMGHIWRLNW